MLFRSVSNAVQLLFASVVVAPILAASPATLRAQQRFTTQVMIVPAFAGADRDAASTASDVVRSRVAAGFPKSELKVISGGDMDEWLRRSGFDENPVLLEGELKELAKKFRADERITGTVRRTAGKVHIDAVDEAAAAVARDAVAARRQLAPLRLCENANRAGNAADAAANAATAIAAYPAAVPARVCLLNALAKLGVSADSVIDVSRAALAVAPMNAVALEDLAQALDVKGSTADAAPVWARLLATDSSDADLVEKVVNALSREGNAKLAAPLIDHGSDSHPDNLPLLKLRWLVHLAERDWAGAVSAGDKLLANDRAAQVDPEFYARLANAYRADSQPARAVATAALGIAKFPHDAPLNIVYIQLLRLESDSALPRALAQFPDNGELHALAAQQMKGSGNAAGALEETKRALAANPKLPHGFLQLAQLEIDLGQPDSAYDATIRATKNGEDSSTVGAFALARGNALYKAATGTQKRDDYQRAMRFLTLATRITPTPQAKFLLGASALSVSQSAATEAPASKSCDLSRLADSTLTEAEINLVSGGSAAPDAAKQYLDYVAKLRPYVADQLKTFCPPTPR
jgi:tetratricopeptide (TPR) repeat protein